MSNAPPHPLLQQIPLVTSPLYNPPKPHTLPSQYCSLTNVKLPDTVTFENLQSWTDECEKLKTEISSFGEKEKDIFIEWEEKDGVRRLAPGFTGEYVLRPVSKMMVAPVSTEKEKSIGEEKREPVNDIDLVFGKLNVKE